MAIPARTITIPAQWATNAVTTIPSPPVPGTPYRNADVPTTTLEQGQLYASIADSSIWNQLMWTITGLVRAIEQYGIPPYSALTNYPAGALALGVDESIYQAIAASGPAYGGAKPTTDATYWTVFKTMVPDGGAASELFPGSRGTLQLSPDNVEADNRTYALTAAACSRLIAEALDPGVQVVTLTGLPSNLIPVYDVTAPHTFSTTQYTASVLWSPQITTGGRWQGSTVYTATINLTARTGYTLVGAGPWTIGLGALTKVSDSQLRVVFPQTASSPEPPVGFLFSDSNGYVVWPGAYCEGYFCSLDYDIYYATGDVVGNRIGNTSEGLPDCDTVDGQYVNVQLFVGVNRAIVITNVFDGWLAPCATT